MNLFFNPTMSTGIAGAADVPHITPVTNPELPDFVTGFRHPGDCFIHGDVYRGGGTTASMGPKLWNPIEVRPKPGQTKIVIGRERNVGNDVVIPYKAISAIHAIFERGDIGWTVSDGDGKGALSKNGTFVNGRQIYSTTPIQYGDDIRLSDKVVVRFF